MAGSDLSEVQRLNFIVLTMLRDASNSDPISACRTFGLSKGDLEALKPHLSADRLLATVVNVGDEALITLRPGVQELLQSPLPLLSQLASVGFGSQGRTNS